MPNSIEDIVKGLKEYGELLKNQQFAFRTWAAGNEDAQKHLKILDKAMTMINDTAEPRVTEFLLLRLVQDEGRLEKFLGDDPEILEALGSSLPNVITAAQSWQAKVVNAPPQAKQEYVVDLNNPPPSLTTPPMPTKNPAINPVASVQPPAQPKTTITPPTAANPVVEPPVPEPPVFPPAPEPPELPTVPEPPDLPPVPEPPDLPLAPEPPELPLAPDSPELPLVPEPPDMPHTLDLPDEPDGPLPTTPLAANMPLHPPPDAVSGKSNAAPNSSIEVMGGFNERFGPGKHEALLKGEKIFAIPANPGQQSAWVQFNSKTNILQSNGPEEMAIVAQNMGYTEFEFTNGDSNIVLESMQAMSAKGIDVSMTPALERKLSPEQRKQYDKIRENNSDFKQISKIADAFGNETQAAKVEHCINLAKKGDVDNANKALEKIAKLPLDKFTISDRASVINALYAEAKRPDISKEESNALKAAGNVVIRALGPADRAQLVDELHKRDINNPNLSTAEVMEKQQKRNETVNNLDRQGNTPKSKWPNSGIAKEYLSITDDEQRAKKFDALPPEQQKKIFNGESPAVKAIIITNLMEKHAALSARTGPQHSDSKKEADRYLESKIKTLLSVESKKDLKATIAAVNSRVEERKDGQKFEDAFRIMNKGLGKSEGFGVPPKTQQEEVQPVRPR